MSSQKLRTYALACASFVLVSFTSAHNMKLVSYNIDTNISRAEEGVARDTFPQWRTNARIPAIRSTLTKIIDEDAPDVIHIQEGRRVTTRFGEVVDSITPVTDLLEELGYGIIIMPYNATGEKAFQYITAYKAAHFTLAEAPMRLYFTQTPHQPTHREDMTGKTDAEIVALKQGILRHNFGEEWERGTLRTHLRDKRTNEDVYTFNVHLGIGQQHRLASCKLLINFVQDLVASSGEGTKIVISGDFNTFPDSGGPEQLQIIQESGILKHGNNVLTLKDGTPVEGSFISFPYDFGKDDRRLNLRDVLSSLPLEARRQKIVEAFTHECSAWGGVLDHIFYRGFSSAKTLLVSDHIVGDGQELYRRRY